MLERQVDTPTPYPSIFVQLLHDQAPALLDGIVNHIKLIKHSLNNDLIGVEVIDACRTINPEAIFPHVVSCDAGNNGVDLRFSYLPLYCATAILTKGWKIVESPISLPGQVGVWTTENYPRIRESLLALRIQFKLTVEALEQWNPNLILFDGPILVHPKLRAVASKALKEDYQHTIADAVKMLEVCWIRNIPVVGFVKRTRKHTLHENIRDTALLNYVLKPGQYTKPRIDEEAQRFHLVEYRSYATKQGYSQEDIEEITCFYTAYAKTGYSTPFRLVLPKYCIPLAHEIISYLTVMASDDGLPFPIREVDQLTKMSTALSHLRFLEVYSRAAELVKTGRLSIEDLELFQLQFGETWTINDAVVTRVR